MLSGRDNISCEGPTAILKELQEHLMSIAHSFHATASCQVSSAGTEAEAKIMDENHGYLQIPIYFAEINSPQSVKKNFTYQHGNGPKSIQKEKHYHSRMDKYKSY